MMKEDHGPTKLLHVIGCLCECVCVCMYVCVCV